MLGDEMKLTLSQAAKKTPGRPNPSTLWRWCRKGQRKGDMNVKLEYVRFGRKIFTSVEALARFSQALAAADAPMGIPEDVGLISHRSSCSDRQRRIEAADGVLRHAGI